MHRRLLYFSPVRLDSLVQRPHHFVRWAADQWVDEVIWVDPLPSRLPRLSDWRRFGAASESGLGPNWQHAEWIRRIRPRAWPLEPLRLGRLLNRRRLAGAYEEIRQAIQDPQAQTWVVVGRASSLALRSARLAPRARLVADLMDDMPEFFDGGARDLLRRQQTALLRLSSTILVSAQGLAERARQSLQAGAAQCPKIVLVPNATDHPARQSRRPPLDGRPLVFGYIGTLSGWFDWAWIVRLAQALPSHQIRLIGPLYQPPPRLPPNVDVRSPVRGEEVVASIDEFDVGLIPFHLSPLTRGVDPLKFYEYRAAGLPVLTTRFGSMAERSAIDGCWFFEDLAASEEGLESIPGLVHSWSAASEQSVVVPGTNRWQDRWRLAAEAAGWPLRPGPPAGLLRES